MTADCTVSNSHIPISLQANSCFLKNNVIFLQYSIVWDWEWATGACLKPLEKSAEAGVFVRYVIMGSPYMTNTTLQPVGK